MLPDACPLPPLLCALQAAAIKEEVQEAMAKNKGSKKGGRADSGKGLPSEAQKRLEALGEWRIQLGGEVSARQRPEEVACSLRLPRKVGRASWEAKPTSGCVLTGRA